MLIQNLQSILKQIIRLRSNGLALQTIAKAINTPRKTVNKYFRLIEGKGVDYDELLQMEDAALDSLLQDPDPADQARLESLIRLFPYFKKELPRSPALVLPVGYSGVSTKGSIPIDIVILSVR